MFPFTKYLFTNSVVLFELFYYPLFPSIIGFMEEILDPHNIIINHNFLICKHNVYLSRSSESLNFIGLKNYILETIILEEK